MWAAEKDPALRADFCNLTILDRVPDPARLERKIGAALVALPRLAQRVVSPPLRLAPPEWQPDPTLDLAYHVRRVALPPPGGMRELLDVTAALSSSPLDRSRPLWVFTLIDGLPGGRAALFQQVHHTITDGVGGLRLSLSIVDLERDAPPDAPSLLGDMPEPPSDPVDRNSLFDLVRDAIEDQTALAVRHTRQALGFGVGLALHPQSVPHVIHAGVELAASIRRQVLITDTGHSRLLAPMSLGRRFDTIAVPFEPVRLAAKDLGVTINDVFAAGVSAGLGRYLNARGEPVDELRMAMPVNVRAGRDDRAANRFVPTRAVVPTSARDADTHVHAVRDALAHVREEPVVSAADALAGIAATLPTALLVTALRSQSRTIDFAASNVRGSPIELFLGGARVDATFPFGPRMGCALNATVISYNGEMCIGLHSDPIAVTEPDLLVDCIGVEFERILSRAE